MRLPIQSVQWRAASVAGHAAGTHSEHRFKFRHLPPLYEEEGLDVVNQCLEFLMDLYRSMLHAALSLICHLTSEDIKNQVATALTLQFVPNMSTRHPRT